LKDWFLLNRGVIPTNLTSYKIFPSINPIAGLVLSVLTAVVLSMLSTVWPINQYMVILSNAAVSRGQWLSILPLTAVYVLISLWPMWLLAVCLLARDLRLSMLKIISAAVFFAASTCMVLIFK